MRTQGLVLAVVAGLLVAADKGADKDGAKAIQGTWLIVSVTEDGKPNEKSKDRKVVFEEKKMIVDTPGGQREGTFTVDPKKKTLDISPSEGPDKGKTFKGIYELKGGQLKICFSRRPDGARPQEFKSEQGSGQILVVLKRDKK